MKIHAFMSSSVGCVSTHALYLQLHVHLLVLVSPCGDTIRVPMALHALLLVLVVGACTSVSEIARR
jgi:hypothetical protein